MTKSKGFLAHWDPLSRHAVFVGIGFFSLIIICGFGPLVYHSIVPEQLPPSQIELQYAKLVVANHEAYEAKDTVSTKCLYRTVGTAAREACLMQNGYAKLDIAYSKASRALLDFKWDYMR